MKLIFNLFNNGGLITIFILIALEYSCFPIPSEVVLPFTGFVCSLNGYSMLGVVILSVIMGYFGCLVCYLIGYYGGAKIYNKIYMKFTKWKKGLDTASNKFSKYGNISVLICRLIPLCRTYISFFAGMFKQNLFQYSLYSIIGILIWNVVLISFGYILMNRWELAGEFYNKYKLVLLFVASITLVLILFYKLYKKVKKAKTINGD